MVALSSSSFSSAYCLLFRSHLRRDALANEQQRPVGPRQCTLDQQQVLRRIHTDLRVVAGRHLVHAHVTGHADALLGFTALTAPGGAGRDRTGRAVFTLGAVRRRLTTEVVPLHDARETLALAGADHIHVLHAVKDRYADRIPELL